MKTTGNENLGSCTEEFLVAGPQPLDVVHVTIKKGMKLTRGTILALDENAKCVSLGTAKVSEETKEPTAAYILAEDVDATEADTTAEAYRSGNFIKDSLKCASSYEITEADIQELRKCGIVLENGIN